jgi:hypothetical protein
MMVRLSVGRPTCLATSFGNAPPVVVSCFPTWKHHCSLPSNVFSELPSGGSTHRTHSPSTFSLRMSHNTPRQQYWFSVLSRYRPCSYFPDRRAANHSSLILCSTDQNSDSLSTTCGAGAGANATGGCTTCDTGAGITGACITGACITGCVATALCVPFK